LASTLEGGKMKKKVQREMSDAELNKIFEKNSIDLERSLGELVEKYKMDFKAPFTENGDEIISQARQAEFGELIKNFPNYSRYGENMKINCRLCLKFHLDPKIVSDRQKIMKAIERKLESPVSSTNLDLFKFCKG
jgi:hypothetical protein